MQSLKQILFKNGKVDKESDLYIELKNDFTFHSSAIEGSKVSKQDNLSLITEPYKIDSLLKKYPEKDVVENLNLIRVFDYVVDTHDEQLSISYIKKIHGILCKDSPDLYDRDEQAGEFRRHDVRVGKHLGARPEYIHILLSKLLKDFKKSLNLNDVAKFHCEYEIIHPFYDGNGRTGRMIMFKQCIQNNIKPFYVENINVRSYYLGIEYYEVTNKTTAMIEYLMNQQERFNIKYLLKFKVKSREKEI
ncbi:MAG: Fic family protein [Mycoplasmataceae bacterium]|jgi:Fic family protein|nr:Fic family protein [Mycoplasmataceae bacterium]